MIDQAGDSGVDQNLGAVDAREVGDIAGTATRGDAVQRGLDDGIGLGMNSTHAMPFHQQMPNLIAMGLAGRGTVKPGGQDAFIQHQHTANQGAVAGAAL